MSNSYSLCFGFSSEMQFVGRHCAQKILEERTKRLSLPRPASVPSQESEEEAFWIEASVELPGEWRCVLSRQPEPNAFVTGTSTAIPLVP